MKIPDKKRSDITAWIWITVILLVILVLITSVLVVTCVLAGADIGTDVIISLTPDQAEETKYKTFYKPADVKPGAGVENDGKAWEAYTEIDLFKSSYLSATGETTVNAANGDKIIAPGTSNVFKFALKNKGNVVLKYTVGIKGLFGLTDKDFPVLVRMRCGNDWVIGSETEWVKISEVKDITYTSEINVGKADVYEAEWQWPFDNDESADTTFGNLGIDVEHDFNITITTVTEEIPGAVAKDEDGNLLYKMIMDPVLFVLIIIIGIFAITLLILLLIFIIKKKEEQDEKKNKHEKQP